MAVDYISTAPWNDPYNPWPAYTTVPMVSSEYIQPVTLQLVYFNPGNTFEEFPYVMKYEGESNWSVTLTYQGLAGGTYDDLWVITRDNDVSYSMTVEHRGSHALPMKMSGSAGDWENQGDDQVETLHISAPLITSVAPWELRRRRLLEIA